MIGVLVMAYGGPDRLEDVEPYLLDVRHHRPTPASLVEEIRQRYTQIGGRSPILERTRAQAAAIARALSDLGLEARVEVGMRHWHPYIAAGLSVLESEGVERAVGLVMAPHYSALSVGAYGRRVREAGSSVHVRLIRSWNLLPEYLAAVTELVRHGLDRFPAAERSEVPIVFTAHSLPERILAEGDPYADELRATFEAVAARVGPGRCRFAYQSAAMTSEAWLGPDVGEVLEELAAEGARSVLIAPIGFTSDHVEILYDIDIEVRAVADRIGLRLERTEMLNDHEGAMRGLARLVRAEAQRAGWT